jgi:hypothetical protein
MTNAFLTAFEIELNNKECKIIFDKSAFNIDTILFCTVKRQGDRLLVNLYKNIKEDFDTHNVSCYVPNDTNFTTRNRKRETYLGALRTLRTIHDYSWDSLHEGLSLMNSIIDNTFVSMGQFIINNKTNFTKVNNSVNSNSYTFTNSDNGIIKLIVYDK